MGTITAANSSFALTIDTLYPAPIQLQGYMADAAFETDNVDNAELVIGVDGNLSAGFVFALMPMTISLMPDSPSSTVFETWASANRAARETYVANGVIRLPSIGVKYACTNGYLTRYAPVPGARRVLQGRPWVVTWQDISGAPM